MSGKGKGKGIGRDPIRKARFKKNFDAKIESGVVFFFLKAKSSLQLSHSLSLRLLTTCPNFVPCTFCNNFH